jgi:enoyl-[acyl-carrier protein] reductase/trans-2-enoyl-CoA reductase (NAD+)
MVIKPKIRNNVCLTAHPVGCAYQVREQIDYVLHRGHTPGPKRALIIGASNGYGLASRIVSAFGCGTATVGVSLEKPGTEKRTGTAGWHNNRAFEREAKKENLSAWSVNGDAFSPEVKGETIELIGNKLGEVDFVVYSIAAPRRLDPETGEIYSSAIKPINDQFTSQTVDIQTGELSPVTAEPATRQEIEHTVKVMGGEDWFGWIHTMASSSVLARNAITISFSYIGPSFTDPIYRLGTIGKAKEDLELTAKKINREFTDQNVRAFISVNKALVTRASAVIPAVTLYISLLYRVMKQKGIHEGCIQQMYRLFRDYLYASNPKPLDRDGRIRLDDLEMREDVQREVAKLWKSVNSQNIETLSDIRGFRKEFLRHHGFGMKGVDYSKDVDVEMTSEDELYI